MTRVGAGQCLLFLAVPSGYDHSAPFFLNDNSKGSEPFFPSQKRPSDTWHGTSLGLPPLGTVSREAQVSSRGAPPSSLPAWGLSAWVCPQNTDRVSNAQGVDPHAVPNVIPTLRTKLTWGLAAETAMNNLSARALSCFSCNGFCENHDF